MQSWYLAGAAERASVANNKESELVAMRNRLGNAAREVLGSPFLAGRVRDMDHGVLLLDAAASGDFEVKTPIRTTSKVEDRGDQFYLRRRICERTGFARDELCLDPADQNSDSRVVAAWGSDGNMLPVHVSPQHVDAYYATLSGIIDRIYEAEIRPVEYLQEAE